MRKMPIIVGSIVSLVVNLLHSKLWLINLASISLSVNFPVRLPRARLPPSESVRILTQDRLTEETNQQQRASDS